MTTMTVEEVEQVQEGAAISVRPTTSGTYTMATRVADGWRIGDAVVPMEAVLRPALEGNVARGVIASVGTVIKYPRGDIWDVVVREPDERGVIRMARLSGQPMRFSQFVNWENHQFPADWSVVSSGEDGHDEARGLATTLWNIESERERLAAEVAAHAQTPVRQEQLDAANSAVEEANSTVEALRADLADLRLRVARNLEQLDDEEITVEHAFSDLGLDRLEAPLWEFEVDVTIRVQARRDDGVARFGDPTLDFLRASVNGASISMDSDWDQGSVETSDFTVNEVRLV